MARTRARRGRMSPARKLSKPWVFKVLRSAAAADLMTTTRRRRRGKLRPSRVIPHAKEATSNGRSPGSRRFKEEARAFPDFSSGVMRAVAGYSCGHSRGLGFSKDRDPHRVPYSPSREGSVPRLWKHAWCDAASEMAPQRRRTFDDAGARPHKIHKIKRLGRRPCWDS